MANISTGMSFKFYFVQGDNKPASGLVPGAFYIFKNALYLAYSDTELQLQGQIIDDVPAGGLQDIVTPLEDRYYVDKVNNTLNYYDGTDWQMIGGVNPEDLKAYMKKPDIVAVPELIDRNLFVTIDAAGNVVYVPYVQIDSKFKGLFDDDTALNAAVFDPVASEGDYAWVKSTGTVWEFVSGVWTDTGIQFTTGVESITTFSGTHTGAVLLNAADIDTFTKAELKQIFQKIVPTDGKMYFGKDGDWVEFDPDSIDLSDYLRKPATKNVRLTILVDDNGVVSYIPLTDTPDTRFKGVFADETALNAEVFNPAAVAGDYAWVESDGFIWIFDGSVWASSGKPYGTGVISVNGKEGPHVDLSAGDVGAFTKEETLDLFKWQVIVT